MTEGQINAVQTPVPPTISRGNNDAEARNKIACSMSRWHKSCVVWYANIVGVGVCAVVIPCCQYESCINIHLFINMSKSAMCLQFWRHTIVRLMDLEGYGQELSSRHWVSTPALAYRNWGRSRKACQVIQCLRWDPNVTPTDYKNQVVPLDESL